jgi:hypothetical protein
VAPVVAGGPKIDPVEFLPYGILLRSVSTAPERCRIARLSSVLAGPVYPGPFRSDPEIAVGAQNEQ